VLQRVALETTGGAMVAMFFCATALLAIVLFVSLNFGNEVGLPYALIGGLLLANASAVLLFVSNLLSGLNGDRESAEGHSPLLRRGIVVRE
jgi:hypothetical protein